MYKRVDGLAAALKRGAADGGPLSPAHEDTIRVLAELVVLRRSLSTMLKPEQRYRGAEQGPGGYCRGAQKPLQAILQRETASRGVTGRRVAT